MKKTAALVAAGLIGFGSLVASPAAHAAQTVQPVAPGTVIAQDTSQLLTATPSAPRAITIQAKPGELVRVKTKGQKARTVKADRDGQARVAKLTAGKPYNVSTQDATTTVTPVVNVGPATDLRVTTTDSPDAVDLTWQHKATKARGGSDITYIVQANPIDDAGQLLTEEASPAVIDEVSDTGAVLADLDPTVRYIFSVTPHNALGDGEPTVARMNRSLSEITGRQAPITTEDSAAPQRSPETPQPRQDPAPAPQPAPAPAPAPGPAPAPKPATKTIYVCPDGFSEDGGQCKKTMGYTYQTQDYTYHYGKTGTENVISRCSSGYTDENGNFHWIEEPHECTVTQDVYGDIKDATPSGWEDTGSNWRKKDDTPSGWSDDGSQWVQTTDKVAKEVPA